MVENPGHPVGTIVFKFTGVAWAGLGGQELFRVKFLKGFQFLTKTFFYFS